MLEIMVTADPKSGIRNALLGFESPFFNVQMPINAGVRSNTSIATPPGTTSVEFALYVFSNERRATVLAEGIWPWSQILVFGINPGHFIGIIQDSLTNPPMSGVSPTCQLRCTPQSQPVTGPGCLPCREDGLVFQVCC
jgi:hypothetical protein